MNALSLRELEDEARRYLPPAVYDYYAGGADDEITLKANTSAYARIGLLPRVLRGADVSDPAIDLLGCRLALPVLIAPTAFHRLAHKEGECATARAASAAGTALILSMASNTAVEEVAAVTGTCLWFQMAIQPDLGFTEKLLRRVETAGCQALVVSVDGAAFGRRERDLRHRFVDLPPGLYCENLREEKSGAIPGALRNMVFTPTIAWRHIDWLRSKTTLPIALKGITHPEDAQRAVACGVDALIVSNHGGRQLDTMPASIELLPAVVAAVAGAVPVLVDGGVRRGTDVLKALALGAAAVAIGRPVLWGLAVGGEAGVREVLDMLRDELMRALALCGCASLRDVSPELLRLPAGWRT